MYTKTTTASNAKKPRRKRDTSIEKARTVLDDIMKDCKDPEMLASFSRLVFIPGYGIKCTVCKVKISHRDIDRINRHCRGPVHEEKVAVYEGDVGLRDQV
jgi:hypothetical protein